MNLKKLILNYTCYYFDDIKEVEDIYSGNVLLDEKSYEIILIYLIQNFYG